MWRTSRPHRDHRLCGGFSAEPLQQIQVEFESLYPEAKLLFHFAGSQQLRTQIELEAAVDVYVSADAAWSTIWSTRA